MTEPPQENISEPRIAIKANELSKLYNSVVALANVSFEVFEGEIYGLLGPNGAGKTTTIRILKGMLKPTTGDAFIFENSILTETNYAKKITGYLPEEGSLMGRLTPMELCEFIGGLFGVSAFNARARAEEFFSIFGLTEKKDELIENLSRGMKQKLSIITSIIHDPQIVLMDEPLASLDPSAAKMVKDFIKYLSKEKKKTVIISSHRLSMMEDVCDRVAIIHHGSILVVDTPKRIMDDTKTNSLEEAYLAIIPGYQKPVYLGNGSLVETQEEEEVNKEGE
ncbi:MAG: ABC transporter ATP-binding protein [Candidatus Heimdallarchaeota archaeon]